MTEISQPRIVLAGASLVPARKETRRLTAHSVGRFARGAGYDGVELFPLLDWGPLSPRRVARAVKLGHLALNSMHASFRTTKRSAETNQGPHKPSLFEWAMSRFGRPLMPEVVGSSKWMRNINQNLGKELPMVMYPQPDPERDKHQIELAGPGLKLVQATDYVAHIFGAKTPEDFIRILKDRGYDGVILDTAHMHQDRYQDQGLLPVISDLDSSLPTLTPHVYGVHFAAGRTDIAKGSERFQHDAAQDLTAALEGRFNGLTTSTAQIMDAAMKSPNLQYVSVEIPSTSLGDFPLNDYWFVANGLRNYIQQSFSPRPQLS